MNVGDTVASVTHRLREAGSPSPRLDAELLVGLVVGRDRSWLLAHPEADLDAEALATLVTRRASGEPIAYIRGFKPWHDLQIRTDRRALIPRPETELLLDAAAREIEARLGTGDRPLVAWEIGTGSGAVALALARRFAEPLAARQLVLVASDVSSDALVLADENLAAHGVAGVVELLDADLLIPAGDSHPRPDVVIANLPYVASDEVDERIGSLGFEPRIATDGGPDGLAVFRRLLQQLPGRVAPGATVLLEIGVDQADAISRMVEPMGASAQVVPDLAGLDRVLRLDLP